MAIHVAPWIVPISAPPVREGAVVVDGDGVIRAVGPASELAKGDDVVEHTGVLMPGLVNAHTHVELSYLGLIPGGDGLARWIRRLLETRVQVFDLLHESDGGRNASRYLASRGTVAVGDVSNDGRVVAHLRAAHIELLDLHEYIAPNQLPGPVRANAVGTAHATYTVGVPVLKQLAALSGGRIRSIHVEEDPGEAAFLVEGHGPLADLLAERGTTPAGTPSGLRPIEHLDAHGLIGPDTLLVHLTFARPSSLKLAAARGAIAVLCPRSNRHITGHLPPFREIQAAGLRVALGTDSLASAPTLDVLGEAQILAQAGADPAWLLHAATKGGADALGLKHLGALAPGLRPAVLVVGDHDVADPIAFVANEGANAPVERLA